MRFIPDYQFEVIDEAVFPEMIQAITEQLNSCKQSGYFVGKGSVRLYYEYFLAQDSRGSVVVVHGLSEFTEKFYELTYYLVKNGYNVFLYDQRCHGHSQRLTRKKDLLHVDRFDDYVTDLSIFIDTVVKSISDAPLYLYTHSMGGGVAALYLAKHTDTFKKAVMSAPLFQPVVKNVNPTIARWGVKIAKVFVGKKRQFSLSKEFNPETAYNPRFDASCTRFEHYMALRRDDEDYQTTPMSYGWVSAALDLRSRVLKNKVVGSIQTSILMFSADQDQVVELEPQYLFDQKCDACHMIRLPSATHSLLTSDREQMTQIIQTVLEFYGS